MINLEPDYLILVQNILKSVVPDCKVMVFGSRTNAKSKKFSDIDLAIIGKERLPLSVLIRLKEAFSESDLPYMVDILDWNLVSPEFRKTIEEQGFEVIQSP